jgi:2-phosphosulfolactate phosphatase
VSIVCSGKLGAPALEDLVCAGMLAAKLRDAGRAEVTESAEAALASYVEHGDDLAAMLAGCEHGRYLASIGMGRDLPYCAGVDRFDVVPRLGEGVIRAAWA